MKADTGVGRSARSRKDVFQKTQQKRNEKWEAFETEDTKGERSK